MERKCYRFLKRLFDILAGIFGLIITTPIWVIAIIGIEFSDPGPVFFGAKRIGKGNREFIMLKFRSMRVAKNEAEKSEASFKADVNRIFPFGEFCRRMKIDELPQLLNVIKGDMSVVGPRPAALDQAEIMRKGKYNIASTVKPGLTGTAALFDYIYGDTVEDLADYEQLVLPTRLELEAYYPQHMSMRYDIKLIWYTVVCLVATLFRKKPQRIYDELVGCVVVEKREFQEVSA